MNANAELLNFIYQNSQMGVDTLGQLTEITEDTGLREYLEKQQEGYARFHKQAREMLEKNGLDEKGLSMMEKVRTYLMVNVQTMQDKSASNIAGMLINGSTMGVVDAIKKLRRYETDSEKDILCLMKELQKFEEKNIEQLKAYL